MPEGRRRRCADFCTLQIFPTGDSHAKMVSRYQPSSFAAMEGLFQTQKVAPLVIIGNPDTERHKPGSVIEMPKLMSFLTARRWDATGLNDIPLTYIANIAGWRRSRRERRRPEMQTAWFVFLALTITMSVILDGFDLGVGALHRILAFSKAYAGAFSGLFVLRSARS